MNKQIQTNANENSLWQLISAANLNCNRISIQKSGSESKFFESILSLKNDFCFGKIPTGKFVTYVMTKNRRLSDNCAKAVAQLIAEKLNLPLIIVETIKFDEMWVSPRFHLFVAQGAHEKLQLEPNYIFAPLCKNGENKDLLQFLFSEAEVVVADWSPLKFEKLNIFDLWNELDLKHIKKQIISIDDNGILPLYSHAKKEYAARFIRPKLQNALAHSLEEFDAVKKIETTYKPLTSNIPPNLFDHAFTSLKKTPIPSLSAMCNEVLEKNFAKPAFDTHIFSGGERSANDFLSLFISKHLNQYHLNRQHPDLDCTSKLSSFLRFGNIHCRTILKQVCLNAHKINPKDFMPETAPHKFIDELITWRELGLNMCRFALDEKIELNSIQMLPEWAQKTLGQYKPDENEIFTLEDLENSKSPNAVWNAANNELKATGLIHNSLRMLWGKGIIRWSNGPQEALTRMEYLNNKFALDGRDSNSYVGFLWCLGKFDRPWPPARHPFGLVRAMSFEIARKKLQMGNYLKKYA